MLGIGNNEGWRQQLGRDCRSPGFLEGSRESGKQMNERHLGYKTNVILQGNGGGTERENIQRDDKQLNCGPKSLFLEETDSVERSVMFPRDTGAPSPH